MIDVTINSNLIPCKVTHGLKNVQLDFSQALRLFQESQLNT
jgi:hypothetical protein